MEEKPEQGKVYPQEFVIDRIVPHIYTPEGEVRYQVRWYGFSPDEDTVEPIEHLPRSKVLSYHRRARVTLPPNLDRAQVGL
ncbi:unnamed protein product [Agarophyton chilense]